MDYSDIINQVSPRHPLSLGQLGDLAQACRVHSGSRVLDLGCYDGTLLNTGPGSMTCAAQALMTMKLPSRKP